MIRDDDIRNKLKELDDHIRKEYIEGHPEKERDWRTYEQLFSKRIKEDMKSLDPLIHEAVSTIRMEKNGAGRPRALRQRKTICMWVVFGGRC